MDGFARHSLYTTYAFKGNDNIKVEMTTLYRNGDVTNAYLFYPKEWSSFSSGKDFNTKKNSYLQIQLNHPYTESTGNGIMKLTVRTPFNYNYAYLQGEMINRKSWKKLDINTRAYVRLGMGNDIPYESALFLQGGNPEEMMENKFTRSQGILPADWGGFATDQFSNIHTGGGLNLRGYNGYYAIDENSSGKYINYKGRSGASMNIELEFDRLVKFRPKNISNYLHLDTYLFADAGAMSRGTLNVSNLPELKPVKQWSKLRADAGVGAALTIKKFGAFEKINPFTVRFDMPLFLSAPPYAQLDQFAFRWVLGVSRAF
jgi:aminopeptidase N